MKIKVCCCLLLGSALVWNTRAANLYDEQFTTGSDGWAAESGGNMTVTGPFSLGSPASGAMEGEFHSVLPENGGFAITSASDAGQNFTGTYGGINEITFDLYANTVLPSDLFLSFTSGSDTFSYQLNTSSMMADTWTTFTVSLASFNGWIGDQSNFNNDLYNVGVGEMDIQMANNGSSDQFYYLDNVQTLEQSNSTLTPEPGSAVLILLGAGMFAVLRMKLYRPLARHP